MDIHKPKPIRNWREFLKEYAIIVIGVLTALAAEQAVEWLHWQSEVKTARAALAAEFALNDTIFARRMAFAPCFERQDDEAKAIIADLLARKPPRRFTTFHSGARSPVNDHGGPSLCAIMVGLEGCSGLVGKDYLVAGHQKPRKATTISPTDAPSVHLVRGARGPDRMANS